MFGRGLFVKTDSYFLIKYERDGGKKGEKEEHVGIICEHLPVEKQRPSPPQCNPADPGTHLPFQCCWLSLTSTRVVALSESCWLSLDPSFLEWLLEESYLAFPPVPGRIGSRWRVPRVIRQPMVGAPGSRGRDGGRQFLLECEVWEHLDSWYNADALHGHLSPGSLSLSLMSVRLQGQSFTQKPFPECSHDIFILRAWGN